ncbi:unnamed protein product, partial [Closterium sp. NIES-53]
GMAAAAAAAAAVTAVSVGASRESRGGVAAAAAAAVSVGALGESRGVAAAAAVSVGASGESRGVAAAAAAAAAAPPPPPPPPTLAAAAAAAAAALSVGASGESRGGVTSAARASTVAADDEGGGAAATATARPARPSTCTLDGPFHLVLRSRVPSPPVLPQPLESSLTVLHDPLSDYLHASRPVVSHVLSELVTHPTAPLSSVSALVTTIVGFASSRRLDYTAHLVSGPARSPSSGGALVYPLQVLEDRQFELGFLPAAVPHLCAMLLAPEGDPDALDIPIPHTNAEAVSGP